MKVPSSKMTGPEHAERAQELFSVALKSHGGISAELLLQESQWHLTMALLHATVETKVSYADHNTRLKHENDWQRALR